MNDVPLLDVAPLAADRVTAFDGTRQYLSTGNVESANHVNPISVTYKDKPTRADLTVRPGDVCLARMKATEKTLEFSADNADVILSTGFAVLRPIPSLLHSRFLLHWLRTRDFNDQKDLLCTGATQMAITNEKLAKLTIPLPPPPEQRRIVAILDQADALRGKRQAAVAELDNLSESIFLEMFGDPDDLVRQQSWEPLERNLLFITSGSRGWAKYYADEGSRFIRSLDVRMNRIADEEAVYVNPPESAEARRTRIESGDVLLTITGSRIGRVATVPSALEGSYISQHVAILRLDKQKLTPDFVSFFLSLNSGGQRQIAKAQYGQTKPGLNLDQIRQLRLPIAPLEMQLEFKRRVYIVSKTKSDQLLSLGHLNSLLESLQHCAFRGEL